MRDLSWREKLLLIFHSNELGRPVTVGNSIAYLPEEVALNDDCDAIEALPISTRPPQKRNQF